jgi:very-short-patch-repair endonuclease
VDPAQVCARYGGVARTFQLSAAGISKRRLRIAVADGVVVRIREGVYAHPMADDKAVHAARHGGRLACVDALKWHGLWVLPDDRLHIAMQPGGRFHEHHPCDVTLVRHWNTPVTAAGMAVEIEPALAQLSRCGTDEAFIVAVESSIAGGRPKLSAAGFARLRDAVSAERAALLSFAIAASDSGLETLVRWRLHLLGIRCRAQVDVSGVGRVDLIVGDRLIIELDGRAYHSSEEAFAVDRRRDAAVAALGFVTLRFSYAQVIHAWDDVVSAVLAAISSGLHETEAGRRLRARAR